MNDTDTLAAAARMLGGKDLHHTKDETWELLASVDRYDRIIGSDWDLAGALLGALTKAGHVWVLTQREFQVAGRCHAMQSYTDNNPPPAILACAARVQLEREKQA
jgi:hypothetical protein